MLLKIYDNELTSKELGRVKRILLAGGIIVYPTDSVYAFGCDAENKVAIERICMLRKKDIKKPSLSIVCESIGQIREFSLFSEDTFKLMRRCLPGPFTFILEGSSRLPKIFKNRKTVGVRIPNHPIVWQILEELGRPMMTSSLQIDADDDIEYMTDPELIDERYGAEVDLVLDAGIGGCVASTIIDCTSDEMIIVRQGAGIVE